MNSRLPSISGKFLSLKGEEDFVVLVKKKWNKEGIAILFSIIWKGLDDLKADLSQVSFTGDEVQIERDLTEHLHDKINEILRDGHPFKIKHSPNELGSQKTRQAKPREYDLAFYLRENTGIKFPIEAKVLRWKNASMSLADYIDTINNKFLTGVYSPFSSEAVLLGYLIGKGDIQSVFDAIAEKLNTPLQQYVGAKNRFHHFSEHIRENSTLSGSFKCHHMLYQIKP